MAKIKINVYTNMNGIVVEKNIDAIMINDVIKYIEGNNKILIDIKNNILEKENNDVSIKIDFVNDKIFIFIKELKREFIKNMEVISLENKKNYFYVKYKLIDENIINEYKVKFL